MAFIPLAADAAETTGRVAVLALELGLGVLAIRTGSRREGALGVALIVIGVLLVLAFVSSVLR